MIPLNHKADLPASLDRNKIHRRNKSNLIIIKLMKLKEYKAKINKIYLIYLQKHYMGNREDIKLDKFKTN